MLLVLHVNREVVYYMVTRPKRSNAVRPCQYDFSGFAPTYALVTCYRFPACIFSSKQHKKKQANLCNS